MIPAAVILLAALVVAVLLHQREVPFMGWAIGGILAATAFLLISHITTPNRPQQVTGFEEAVGWKLADFAANQHGSGELIILQESVLLDGPSGQAQRAGIERGLGGLRPVWTPLATPNELEAGDPNAMRKRSQSLVQVVKDADNPVGILSMVPIDPLLTDPVLKQLPPVYLFALASDPVHQPRLARGEYGAVAIPRLGADNTKDPVKNMQKRFDQRFELVTE